MLALDYDEALCPRSLVLPAHVVRGVVDEWVETASARGIELRFHATKTPPVLADPLALHRVFENLIKNAIEAIVSPRGCIDVRVESADAALVRVSVDDSGGGAAADLESVVRFVTTKHGGSGLGLAIARRIVEDHGGHVSFERRAPCGVRVHVELPTAAAEEFQPS
jgi:signal transduction histidine kinase